MQKPPDLLPDDPGGKDRRGKTKMAEVKKCERISELGTGKNQTIIIVFLAVAGFLIRLEWTPSVRLVKLNV